MKKNNLEPDDSSQEVSVVGMKETSSDWELSGITIFRALGYVVGLLSLIVGTALLMLGFTLANTTLIHVATGLYSLAVAALVGRIVIERFKPQNEIQAALVGLAMMGVGGLVYGLIFLILVMAG